MSDRYKYEDKYHIVSQKVCDNGFYPLSLEMHLRRELFNSDRSNYISKDLKPGA